MSDETTDTQGQDTFALLRAATVGSTPKLRSERVPVQHPSGADLEIEVREVSFGTKQRVAKACMKRGARGDDFQMDMAKFQLLMLVESCFDPSSGKQLFSRADARAIAEQAAGGWLSRVQDAVNRINGNDDRSEVAEGYAPGEVAALLHRVADDLEEHADYVRADELRALAEDVLREPEPVALLPEAEDAEEGNS